MSLSLPLWTPNLPAFQIESTLWQHAYFYLISKSKSSLNLQCTSLVRELGQSIYFSSLNAEQSFSLTPSCLNKLLLHWWHCSFEVISSLQGKILINIMRQRYVYIYYKSYYRRDIYIRKKYHLSNHSFKSCWVLLLLSFLHGETSCNELSRLLDRDQMTNSYILFLAWTDIVTRNTSILKHCKMFL